MLNGANGEMGVVKLRPTCTVGSCDSSDRGRCAVQPGSIVLAFNVIHYYSIYCISADPGRRKGERVRE